MSRFMAVCLVFTCAVSARNASAPAKGAKDNCKTGAEQYAAGDVLKALQTLEKCLEKDPGNRAAWMTLASAHMEAGHFLKASDAFGKAHALKPLDAATLATYLEAQEGSGQVEEQIPVLRAMLAKDPSDRKIAERYVTVIEASGPTKYTEDYMTALEALTKGPDGGGMYGEKLGVLYLKAGRFEKAETLYRKLLTRQKENAELWADLARAQTKSDPKAAAESYHKAILYSDQMSQRQAYQAALDNLGKPAQGNSQVAKAEPPKSSPPSVVSSPVPANPPATVKRPDVSIPPVSASPSSAKQESRKATGSSQKASEDSAFKSDLEKLMATVRKSSEAQQKSAQETEKETKVAEKKAKEEEKKAKEEAERTAKLEAARKAKARVDSLAKVEADRKLAAAASKEAEKKAKEELARLAKAEHERKAKERSDSLARVEADKKATKEADKKAKEEFAKLSKAEAERKAKLRADSLAKVEADRKLAAEAVKKAKEETERVAKLESERKAKIKADSLAKVEADRKLTAEVVRKVKEETERIAKLEAERKAKDRADSLVKVEADRKLAAEVVRKVKEETERIAKLEAERKAKVRADSLVKVEANKKLATEVAKKAKEETDRLAKLEAERKAKVKADSLAKVEADRKLAAEVVRKVKEETERLAKLEAERKAKVRADSLVKVEADRKAAVELEKKTRMSRATAHYQEGRLDSAEALLKLILKEEPTPEAHFFAGRVELDRGHFDKALGHLAQAPADKPNLDGLKGKAQKALGKNKEALESLERQYGKTKDDALLADLYELKLKAGDRPGAMGYLEKLALKDPRNEKYQLELAAFYGSQGNASKAAERYTQILIYQPEHPESNLKLGLEASKRGDHARAVSMLEKAVVKLPNHIEARKALAKGYLALNKRPEAWEAHKKAIQLLPSDLELARGKLALAKDPGREAELHQAYFDILKISPADGDANLGFAKLLFREKDFANAEKYFRVVIPASKEKETWVEFGRSLMEQKKVDEATSALQKAVELGENNPAIRIDLARIHMDKGDLDKAEVLTKGLSKQYPTDPEPLYWQGQIAVKRQQTPLAEEFFRKANHLKPDEGRYALSLAKLYRERDAYKQVIPILQPIEAKLPGEGKLLLGDCLAMDGEKEKALDIYTRQYQKDPSPALLSRRIDLLVKLGRLEKAAELAQGSSYLGAREVQFSLAKTQLALASSHSLKGDLESAESLMKKVLKGNDANPEFHYYLGMVYYSDGKYKKAVDEFTDAQRYRMDYPDALFLKGVSLVKLGVLVEAGDCFRELTQHADLGWKSKGLYGLALEFEAEGKWEAVEHHLVKSIATVPSADAMAFLSRVCLKLGKIPESEDWAKKALAIDPNHEEATLALADALSARKRYSEAIDLAKQALRTKPRSCALLVQSAKLNYQAGNLDASLSSSNGAIQMCPEEPMAYYYAGVVNQGSNKPEEAKRYFKSFKKLGGDKKLLPENN